jgi:hypothetical protein
MGFNLTPDILYFALIFNLNGSITPGVITKKHGVRSFHATFLFIVFNYSTDYRLVKVITFITFVYQCAITSRAWGQQGMGSGLAITHCFYGCP